MNISIHINPTDVCNDTPWTLWRPTQGHLLPTRRNYSSRHPEYTGNKLSRTIAILPGSDTN